MPTEVASMLAKGMDSFAQHDSMEQLRALPQTFAFPGWETEPITDGLPAVPPMSMEWTFAHPARVYTMPLPNVGGYAEQGASAGRTVDPGFSTHVRSQFAAQGHYDAVPTWNNEQAEGDGTPSVHGRALRQGILTQMAGYNPSGPESAMSFVAALARTRTASSGMGMVP